MPSTSQIFEPLPWSIHTAHGGASCQLDATPPASTDSASARIACDFSVRASMTFSCSMMSWSIRSSSGSAPGEVRSLAVGADKDMVCLFSAELSLRIGGL